MTRVKVKREKLPIKTYGVGEPEKNPMFFEKRVYQGSCGKVYPVPFIDKVYDAPSMKKYDAVTLENEYVRLVLLPELGGRIYIAQDKKNGNYDFFYRNDVIKPALVEEYKSVASQFKGKKKEEPAPEPNGNASVS